MKGKTVKRINVEVVKEITSADTITADFAIFNHLANVPLFDYPNRLDCVMLSLCISGWMEVGIDLERHVLKPGQLAVMRPNQILQLFNVSGDFSGRFIVLSRKFLEEAQIDIRNMLPIFLYFKNNPITDLNRTEIATILEYHSLLQKKTQLKDPLFRKNVAQHLFHALFYEVNLFFSEHYINTSQSKTRKDELFERFMKEVSEHYKEERSVSFYADRMCLTPKYLSSAIKEISGKLASEWIDECVILEAKTLLKSSDKSIQQIAGELHFANQSFFGKYFKQHTGISPSQYKAQ